MTRGATGDQPLEEQRLARWVQAVVRRWRAGGVAGRELAGLFRRLLHELVVARTRGAVTDQIVGTDPGTVADRLAASRTSTLLPSRRIPSRRRTSRRTRS